jgi:hypothetical protein
MKFSASAYSLPVEELTCLATWKDNNAHYIVGTLSHSRAITNEERFRCFVYEKINANSKHGECAHEFRSHPWICILPLLHHLLPECGDNLTECNSLSLGVLRVRQKSTRLECLRAPTHLTFRVALHQAKSSLEKGFKPALSANYSISGAALGSHSTTKSLINVNKAQENFAEASSLCHPLALQMICV